MACIASVCGSLNASETQLSRDSALRIGSQLSSSTQVFFFSLIAHKWVKCIFSIVGMLLCRYVTRDRVQNMLDYEYLQCFLTLKTARGKDTCFFAFADTVVAKAFGRNNECHGWLGIKYQSRPG